MATGSQAWADEAPKKADSSVIEEVVVTARRAAIESAQERKKHAEVIVDSVVADDAGKLPDNSITEVLQRVSGVAIVRFSALGNPDSFSAEGSGIQVRGLSGVAGRLNGREIFSANGGRGLSWGDVTPELMAAVDVYKSATADQIEGGTGGQIDLRTKLPFDYNKPALQATASASYGDLVKDTTYGGSVLATRTWDTAIGKVGVLLDLAQNKYSSNADFFRMEPYYHTKVGGQDRYIPGGYDYGDQSFNRTRTGAYLGLQWQPTDSLRLFQTVFVSEYEEESTATGLFVVSKNLSVDPAVSQFDASGGLIRTDAMFVRDNATFAPSSDPISAGGNTGYGKGTSKTRDFSTGFEWTPEGPWSLRGAFQVVDSSATRGSYDVFPGVRFPGRFGLDLTGDLPQVTLPASAAAVFADPASYTWEATMDHNERNHGHLYAGNLDAEYKFSDDAFFRSLKVGVRYADRTERDLNSGYNWTALGRGWNGDPQLTFANARAGDVETRIFENFFRGKANLPGNTLMPSQAMASRFDVVGDHARPPAGFDPALGQPTPTGYGNPVQPIAYGPFDFLRNQTITTAAYATLRFASDSSILKWPVSGNVGLRVVRVENESSGFFQQNEAQFIRNGVLTAIANLGEERADGLTVTRVLPAMNLQFSPTEDYRLRFAYNVTMDHPGFSALKASGNTSVRTISSGGGGGAPPIFDGFTTDTGNPRLKPILSNNLDASLEWYPNRSDSLSLAVFHKRLENLLVYGATNQPVPVTYLAPTPGTVIESAQATNVFNSEADGKISGVEIGGRMFFDFLPGPLAGFGIEANYTYIHSKNPGDQYVDINGGVHTDVPITGLSKHNFNVTGLYERGRLSARVAYSWRSEYLMSTNSNGTNGDYTYYSAPGAGTFTDIALPVYANAYGSLDAGVTFKINDHASFSIEGSNLANKIVKTSMGGYPDDRKYTRSWFVADRRVNASLRLSF
ncbi:TonB-dependent receptor [Caulobacter sp. AP07]|uniref:TonB-dependent receptor n=1 Tax=Caulobacter sp. AP07 TaxID=1144304 RepID=UPI00055688F4|nr:TonB-dependent receptor [Caulobacter sp. AP07]